MMWRKTKSRFLSNRLVKYEESKGVIIFIVKLLISVGLLGYLVTRIDSERFVQTLASANFSYIALAIAGLSFDPNRERDEVDGSDPAAWHQDALQRVW